MKTPRIIRRTSQASRQRSQIKKLQSFNGHVTRLLGAILARNENVSGMLAKHQSDIEMLQCRQHGITSFPSTPDLSFTIVGDCVTKKYPESH
jgi:hypothetical protein